MSKVVIIGGGVSGVICAIYAKKNGNDVTILEKNSDILKKLLITGSGRCNFFNSDQNITHYHSSNKEYLKDIITNENIDELLKFYEKIGIIPRIKDGYYYPYSNQAKSVKNAFESEIKSLGINVICNYDVKKIKHINYSFIINDDLKFDVLVMSTGSKSYPKTGSDGYGYDLLKKLNHNINMLNPALTSLKSNDKILNILSKVRVNAKISLYENDKLLKSEIGEVQFLNKEVSGICTFNLSYLVNKNNYVKINFMPFLNENFTDFINRRNKIMKNRNIFELLSGILNEKVIYAILKRVNVKEDIYLDDMSKKEKQLLEDNILNFKIDITGVSDFDKAQVTKGGIPLSEIKINSMESKKIHNLYITGELLDVNGDCGGYNLTFAFISGFLAGSDIK